jgi:hypothetical protein
MFVFCGQKESPSNHHLRMIAKETPLVHAFQDRILFLQSLTLPEASFILVCFAVLEIQKFLSTIFIGYGED